MSREELQHLISAITPYDEREAADKQNTLDWVASGASLYRIQKPDVPPKHLVSYFAIVDPKNSKILLQDHLLAKKWLPAGGHVDPGEDPAETVRRECEEELSIPAVFQGEAMPHFVTITTTNGQGEHTDVSLWYLLKADEATPLTLEPGKFAEVRWWDISEVLASPIDLFDPELHRFIGKLQQASLV